MAFTAATSRRVLYEDSPAGFMYPIGNTPAKPVLPAGEHTPATCKVLLLGCGDVRNALTTAAALHSSGTLTADIHINDRAVAILARDALLLAVAATIDPGSSADVDFLWCLWFSALISQEHRQRLDTLLQQAIDGRLPQCITFASSTCTEPLYQQLCSIWHTWLHCRKSPSVLAAERKAFMLSSINRRQEAMGGAPRSWQEACSIASISTVLGSSVMDYELLPQTVQDSMCNELKVYYQHGSILSDGTACQGPEVNPTLMDEQCSWRVHDSSCPFDCFPLFTHQQLFAGGSRSSKQAGASRAIASQRPGILTRAAQQALQQMVHRCQAAAAAGAANSGGNGTASSSSSSSAVRFVLHGGDAVELCAAGSSLGDEARFHAIDLSNVGDHSGLLNILVAAGPRLAASPCSRLTADTMTWSSSKASSMTEYLTAALGGHPSLLPALLGLRICTDTRFGRPEPYNMHDRIATQSSNTRQLEFAPAGACAAAAFGHDGGSSSGSGSSKSKGNSKAKQGVQRSRSSAIDIGITAAPLFAAPTLLLPPKAGACGLSDALLTLQKLCCCSVTGQLASDRSGLVLQTPATLARLLMGMAQRVKLHIADTDSSSSSSSSSSNGGQGGDASEAPAAAAASGSSSKWQQLLQVPERWQLEPPFQPSWRAAWHWVLQEAGSTAAANAADSSNRGSSSGSSSALPLPPKPLVYSGFMQPLGLQVAVTPLLRLVLITDAAAQALAAAPLSSSWQQLAQLTAAATAAVGGMGAATAATAAAAVGTFGAVCDALDKGKQLPGAAAGGVVVLDNVKVVADAFEPCRKPLQVSFLLPADHCLDPSTTSVGMLQLPSGCLHCAPLQLAAFTATPLQAPAPVLAAAAAPVAPKNAVGCRNPAVLHPAAAGAAAAAVPDGLQLVQLHEDAAAYIATLRVAGNEACSGLTAEPTMLAAAADGVTHEVVFGLKQPTGIQPFKLQLLHPVDTSRAKYTLSKGTRTITARLPKSTDPDWPCDLKQQGQLLRRLEVEQALPPVDLHHRQWGAWMSEMWGHAEIAEQMRHGNLELGDPFRDLRETIKIFFIRAVKGESTVHQIIDKEAPEDSDESQAMYVRVHTPLRRLPNSRPLAVLTAVDNVLGLTLLRQGKINQMQEVRRFQEVINPASQPVYPILCSRKELQLLRALFTRNSRRMVPTKWQLQHIPTDPSSHWIATYVTPLYPEVLGDGSLLRSIPDAVWDQATAAARAAARGGATQAASAAAAAAAVAAIGGGSRGTARHGASSSSSNSNWAAGAAASAGTPCCRVCGVKEGSSSGGGGSAVRLLRCSCCKSDSDKYCSAQCQRTDWPRHKRSCKRS